MAEEQLQGESPTATDHRLICPLPQPGTDGQGFRLVTATVSAGGEALFLFISQDPEQDVTSRTETGFASFPNTSMPSGPKPFRLAIVRQGAVGDGVETRLVDIPPVNVCFPKVELFPDGRVLLVGSRCSCEGLGRWDNNTHIFDPRTGSMFDFCLGDGIESLAVDGQGRIWVAYFDEGIFGNCGWGREDSHLPNVWVDAVGGCGLVCFNASGQILWEAPRGVDIWNSYQWNATRSEMWLPFRSYRFSVCHISGLAQDPKAKGDGQGNPVVRLYESSDRNLGGHRLCVVSGDTMLLSNGYFYEQHEFHLLTNSRDVMIETPLGGDAIEPFSCKELVDHVERRFQQKGDKCRIIMSKEEFAALPATEINNVSEPGPLPSVPVNDTSSTAVTAVTNEAECKDQQQTNGDDNKENAVSTGSAQPDGVEKQGTDNTEAPPPEAAATSDYEDWIKKSKQELDTCPHVKTVSVEQLKQLTLGVVARGRQLNYFTDEGWFQMDLDQVKLTC